VKLTSKNHANSEGAAEADSIATATNSTGAVPGVVVVVVVVAIAAAVADRVVDFRKPQGLVQRAFRAYEA
jgi:hypothetical protein